MASKPMTCMDDKQDFVQWLQQQSVPEAQYALERYNRSFGYHMTGHFHSGFFGIRGFLRANPGYQGALATKIWFYSFWKANGTLQAALAAFVQAHWAAFPGQRGGDWRKKLPPRQGGTQKGGGAGSGLIARLLILLDRYGQQRGY